MPRMSPLEFKLWKDRLTFADNFWKESGCTGESVNGRFHIGLLGAAYRGEQWMGQSWGGLSHDELVTVNLMFSSTNTLIAGLSARAAKPIVKPKGQSLAQDDASRRAQLNEVLLGSVAADLKFKRQVDMATLDAALFPAGFVRHGYTPRAEKYAKDGRLLEMYDKALPDFPWIRRMRISDLRVDPLASSLFPDEDARWCAFRDLYHLEEVKLNPGFTNRRDLRPTYVIAEDKTKPVALTNDGGPDERKLVEVWTVYDKVERKWFCISPGSDAPLRDPDDWPIPWDSLPYDVLFFNANPLSIMPIALPETYYDLCVELNKVRTMMSALVKRMRYAVIVNDQALAEGEIDKMVDAELKEFFKSNGADVRGVAAAIKLGEFPQELLLYDQRIREDIREVLGISNMDRAQRINVETATEAQGVMEGSNILRSRAEEKVEEFWSNIFRKNHRAIQVTQTEDILLTIFDQKGVNELIRSSMNAGGGVKITPNDLQGEFHYGVQKGSTLPDNPQQELASAAALFQLFKDDTLVDQRKIRYDVLVAARRDADRLLATAPNEQAQNLTDLGQMGVGRSLAAAEKPGTTEPAMPPPQANAPADVTDSASSGIDPALMAGLQQSGVGLTGVPQ